MENSTKAIMIGVALFITISVISAVILITGIGTDAMNSSNQRLEGVASNVASQLIADYDDTEITGASVIATIKKFYNKPNFLLCLGDDSSFSTLKIDTETEFKKDGTMYVFKGSLEQNTANITGLSSKIDPKAMYKSYIIYESGTDTILGIRFDKK